MCYVVNPANPRPGPSILKANKPFTYCRSAEIGEERETLPTASGLYSRIYPVVCA